MRVNDINNRNDEIRHIGACHLFAYTALGGLAGGLIDWSLTGELRGGIFAGLMSGACGGACLHYPVAHLYRKFKHMFRDIRVSPQARLAEHDGHNNELYEMGSNGTERSDDISIEEGSFAEAIRKEESVENEICAYIV